MATISLSLSPKPFLSINKPKPYCFLAPKKATTSSERPSLSHNLLQRITHKSTQVWRVSAASGGEVVPSEAAPLESSQEIVSTSDDGVSNIISGLLLIAFIGLSVLTIGVKTLSQNARFPCYVMLFCIQLAIIVILGCGFLLN